MSSNFPAAFVVINRLALHLSEAGLTATENKRLTEQLKSEEWDAHRVLWKLQDVPANAEGCAYVQGSVHTQEIFEKALTSHLQLIMGLCTIRKWRLSRGCKLSECTHGAPWLRLGDFLVYGTMISIWSLGDDYSDEAEPSLANWYIF